ncbi:hypothetical protein B4144_3005 [Bacillus atrophaeus]|nr:hypothetical protein B4144_3005 [Bacillus atrophaeus]
MIIIQRNHLTNFQHFNVCIKTIKKEIRKLPDIISAVNKKKSVFWKN